MFLVAVLVVLFYQDVSYPIKLVELLFGYVTYQWIINKINALFGSISQRAGNEVVHYENQDQEKPAPPSVDIIMLSVTIIQTINDTYRTEYQLNAILSQLEEENNSLKEKFEIQREIQMEEREHLEEEKFNLELKIKSTMREKKYLKAIEYEQLVEQSSNLEDLLVEDNVIEISNETKPCENEEIPAECVKETLEMPRDQPTKDENDFEKLEVSMKGDGDQFGEAFVDNSHKLEQLDTIEAREQLEHATPEDVNALEEDIETSQLEQEMGLPMLYSEKMKAQLEFIRSLD